MGYIGLPVLKVGRVWLNGAVSEVRAPPIAPSVKRAGRPPQAFQGKEGVDGSSPSEGLKEVQSGASS